MIYEIAHQEHYSRGELLLRSLFGVFYIVLPHLFILLFLGMWGAILQIISTFTILFTGRYPESFFEYQVKLMRWGARLNARMYNLSDGYPAFGLDSTDDFVTFEVEYPERISRVKTLLRMFFGFFYVLIPHGIILYFMMLIAGILGFLSFWAVLFTGKFPAGWHKFIVGTLRWGARVNLYISHMTDEYPPFSGDPDPQAVAVSPSPTPEAPVA